MPLSLPSFQINPRTKAIAAVLYTILWAILNLILGGFYDAITWTCFVVSCCAAGFVAWQYLSLCEKIIRGELDPACILPMR